MSVGRSGSVQKLTFTSHIPAAPSTSSQAVPMAIRSIREPRPCSRTRCGGSSSAITVSTQIGNQRTSTWKRAAAPTPRGSIRCSRNSSRKWSQNAGRIERSDTIA